MKTYSFLCAGSLGAILLAPAALAGCSGDSAPATDTSEARIDARRTSTVCSDPMPSSDGRYVLVDLCPTNGGPGQVVRITVEGGAIEPVATYPADHTIRMTGQSGGFFYFAADYGSTWEVTSRDWELTQPAFAVTAPPGAGTYAPRYP